jgi:hypothetical protein
MIAKKSFNFLNNVDSFSYYFIAQYPYAINSASYDLMYSH